jgi:hypothetical protein
MEALHVIADTLSRVLEIGGWAALDAPDTWREAVK